MRVLALADLHGEVEALKGLMDAVPEHDVIVFVGDVTDFGGAGAAREIVSVLRAGGKKVFVLPGNCDPKPVVDCLEEEGVSLHGKQEEFNGVRFFGFGGSNKTPFGTALEFSEEELKSRFVGVGAVGGFMASHAPPKDTVCDMVPDGSHVGSLGVRAAIEELKPRWVVCGHIHEGRGQDKVGGCVVVNPGQACKGYYATIDINVGEVIMGGLDEARKTAEE